jgi:uncharacterized protein (TIGR03437 family)
MKLSITRRTALQAVFGGAVASAQVGSVNPMVIQRRGKSLLTTSSGGLLCEYPCFWGAIRYEGPRSVPFEFSCVPPGSAWIGDGRRWELENRLRSLPIRRVDFQPFLLASNDVTFEQWQAVRLLPRVREDLPLLSPQELNAETAMHPIQFGMTFRRFEEYCERLGRYLGIRISAPSEAQWEYGARAGTETRYYFGNAIEAELEGRVATGRFEPVNRAIYPNRFGLHNLFGGGQEWCADYVNTDYSGAPLTGNAWISNGDSGSRVIRGVGGVRVGGSAYRWQFIVNGFYEPLGGRPAIQIAHGVREVHLIAATLADTAANAVLAPNSVLSLYGDFFADDSSHQGLSGNGLLPTELGGVSVYCGFEAVPLLYVSRNQINCIAPDNLTLGSKVPIVVHSGFQSSSPIVFEARSAVPGLLSGGPNLFATGRFDDGSVFVGDRPVQPGSMVSLFATGLGVLRERVAIGSIASDRAATVEAFRVTIGGEEAAVRFSGSVAGLPIGVYGVEIEIPRSLSAGIYEARIALAGGAFSSPVFIAIGR